MPTTTLVLNHARPIPLQTRKHRTALRRVIDLVQGVISGTEPGGSYTLLTDETALGTAGVASKACAVFRMASSTGTITATIDGTAVAITWATDDTTSQGLLVDAINANATVKPFVRATRYVAQLAMASVVAGTTITIGGLTYTATAAATSKLREFSIAGADAADATALANAINADPALVGKYVATADGTNAVVYIGTVGDRATTSAEKPIASAATFTVTDFAAGAVSMVYAVTPGRIGNCCTITATGTNASIRTANSGKLGQGVGGLITAQVTDYDR